MLFRNALAKWTDSVGHVWTQIECFKHHMFCQRKTCNSNASWNHECKKVPALSFWARGDCVSTVGFLGDGMVKNYIKHQDKDNWKNMKLSQVTSWIRIGFRYNSTAFSPVFQFFFSETALFVFWFLEQEISIHHFFMFLYSSDLTIKMVCFGMLCKVNRDWESLLCISRINYNYFNFKLYLLELFC